MAEYSFLGPFRNLLRREFFNLMEKAVRTDEGRRIVWNVMKGLTSNRAAVLLLSEPVASLDALGEDGESQIDEPERKERSRI